MQNSVISTIEIKENVIDNKTKNDTTPSKIRKKIIKILKSWKSNGKSREAPLKSQAT